MDKYQTWVRNGLTRTGKTAKGLADALGVAPARVTEITKGLRKVKLSEIGKIAAYLDLQPPPDAVSITTLTVKRVMVVGRIEAGTWREKAEEADLSASVPAVIDPRYPAEDQQAYKIGTKCEALGLEINDYVIVVPFKGDDGDIARRILLVCKIMRQGLEAFALGEINRSNSTEVTFLIPSDYKNISLTKASIVGRIIALHRPYV